MRNYKYFIASVISSMMLFACSKSEPYDIVGEPEVKFFTRLESAGNAPQNSIIFNVSQIPNTAGSGWVNLTNSVPAVIKFPVYSTKPLKEDVTIGAELDNSLIAKYNTANGTSYAAFPNGFLNTANLTANFAKDATATTDSISIITDGANVNNLTGKAYMAPIKLTTVSKPGAGTITNSSTYVAYIIVNVELRQIKYLATAAEAQGTLITPRTPWAVTLTPTPTTVGSITDGLTTTFSRWGVSPGTVDVNLQSTKSITGIRLYTSNSATYTPTQVDVYLSNDGINYDLIGSPLKANLTYANSYNYILFYKAIPAKYIRIRLSYSTSTNTQNTRVTELDVYSL